MNRNSNPDNELPQNIVLLSRRRMLSSTCQAILGGIAAGSMTSLIAGCGGGDSNGGNGNNSGSGSGENIRGTVSVPRATRIVTPFGSVAINTGSKYAAKGSAQYPHMIVALDDSSGTHGLSFHVPGKPQTDVTPETTALSLVALTTPFAVTNRDDFETFANKVSSLTAYGTFVKQITDGLSNAALEEVLAQPSIASTLQTVHQEMALSRHVKRATRQTAGLVGADDAFVCAASDTTDTSAVKVDLTNSGGRVLRVYRRKISGGQPGKIEQPKFTNTLLPNNLMMGRAAAGLLNSFNSALAPYTESENVNLVDSATAGVSYEYWTGGLGTGESGNEPPSEMIFDDAELAAATVFLYVIVPIMSKIVPLPKGVWGPALEAFLSRFLSLFTSVNLSNRESFTTEVLGVVKDVLSSKDFWAEMYKIGSKASASSFQALTEWAVGRLFSLLESGLTVLNIAFFVGDVATLAKNDKNTLQLETANGAESWVVSEDGNVKIGLVMLYIEELAKWIQDLQSENPNTVPSAAEFRDKFNSLVTVSYDNQTIPMAGTETGGYIKATLPSLSPGMSGLLEVFYRGKRIARTDLVIPPVLNVTVTARIIPSKGTEGSGSCSITGTYQLLQLPKYFTEVIEFDTKIISSNVSAGGTVSFKRYGSALARTVSSISDETDEGKPLLTFKLGNGFFIDKIYQITSINGTLPYKATTIVDGEDPKVILTRTSFGYSSSDLRASINGISPGSHSDQYSSDNEPDLSVITDISWQ